MSPFSIFVSLLQMMIDFIWTGPKKNSRKLNKFIGSTKIGPTNKKVKHEHREVR